MLMIMTMYLEMTKLMKLCHVSILLKFILNWLNGMYASLRKNVTQFMSKSYIKFVNIKKIIQYLIYLI